MNTTIPIHGHFREATKMGERERYDALATALGHVMLKFLNARINAMLGFTALLFLCAWLATSRHMGVTVVAICVWVAHLALFLIVDIAKGGEI